MRRRSRKLIGTCAMLTFVSLYASIVMLVAQTDGIRHANGVLQGLFFLVAGLGWILPLMPLIRWMERPDPESEAILR